MTSIRVRFGFFLLFLFNSCGLETLPITIKSNINMVHVAVHGQSRAHFLSQESTWRQISDLFVFVLFVALKKKIPSKISILSRFVCLNSVLFNLLFVCELFFCFVVVVVVVVVVVCCFGGFWFLFFCFFRTPAVNSVSDFFFPLCVFSLSLSHAVPSLAEQTTEGRPSGARTSRVSRY